MLTVNRKLRRTLPFLETLKNVLPNMRKKKMLQSFPDYVLDDMVEILYNILYENVRLRNGKFKPTLMKYKKPLANIVNLKLRKSKRRSLMRQQSGGFIGALIPILASTLISALT